MTQTHPPIHVGSLVVAKRVGRLPKDGWALTEQQLRATIQEIQTGRDQGRSP